MNRLKALFARKNQNLLNLYVPAGYPELHSMPGLVKSLERAGADMIELGVPYSDPIADGPVIQACHKKALENGMNLQILLNQVQQLRSSVDLPLVLMSYFNPLYRFGFEAFCEAAKEAGLDGLIIPDLPHEIYLEKYATFVESNGLAMTFLVSPLSDEARIRKLAELSTGFLYAVASSSTTGSSKGTDHAFLKRLANMNLPCPVLAGFGISNRADFEQVGEQVNGGIIGSALLRTLENSPEQAELAAAAFCRAVLGLEEMATSNIQKS